jgi:hypothetical protein
VAWRGIRGRGANRHTVETVGCVVAQGIVGTVGRVAVRCAVKDTGRGATRNAVRTAECMVAQHTVSDVGWVVVRHGGVD